MRVGIRQKGIGRYDVRDVNKWVCIAIKPYPRTVLNPGLSTADRVCVVPAFGCYVLGVIVYPAHVVSFT